MSTPVRSLLISRPCATLAATVLDRSLAPSVEMIEILSTLASGSDAERTEMFAGLGLELFMSTAERSDLKRVAELINRLRGSGVQGGADTEEAWLVRQLDVAVKNKSAVLITVPMPNGSEVVFPMIPTSVASGRMRGTDQKAGVERTLPLASITQVTAL